jgi:hypothetical protein
MVKTRKYRKNKTRSKRGGEKTCRQNEQDWRQHWSPDHSKRGAIPMRVKEECCKEFNKNTRYYGAWNIMKGQRYPEKDGMKGECDEYIPQNNFRQDYGNYTEAKVRENYTDPFASIPRAQTSYPISVGEPVAQKVQSSDELYAELYNPK